ncbi:MAG: FtsX-like permease family protein [Chloroflexi bacterium]|nr:FtsX-like permease family protein [Chloroflexota bacterium]
MNLSESFLTALDSITANKMRSILTMLGVIIGVAAVIALMAIGNGVTASVTGEINSIGTNLITISPDMENSGGYLPLSLNDVEAIKENAPAVSDVAASVQGNQEVVYDGSAYATSVYGVTANYFVVNNLDDFQAGDGLVQNDLDSKARVAVVGVDVVTELFGDEYPVGKPIKINGVEYEIVGVLESQSGSLAGNPDENVYIPLTTAQSRLYSDRTRSGQPAVNTITAQAVDENQAEAAVDQITETLRAEHSIAVGDEDDFSTFSQTELLDTVSAITGTLTAFLGAIAAISLLVGGIGIMNIMLVSVTERTREIGIRKAIGALKRDILAQFLLESVSVSLLGGFLGILFGIMMALAASNLLGLDLVIEPLTVILATGFAAGIGLIFGLYPAWRAASLRPIEALRYE